ncbi:hypothetical protein SCLCIDRAFT_12145 [Scleroderma citrinum Foug A]|uniref:Transcription factor CBF/NF-Y/archaeal histone domain-containing protein n=1 Tax=Scleroderma citrinum Foug A TaxID=1036808 RepID=A0A0C2YNN8_9AGAM|nr:hypothetical protein SCLCIDRAFT_12145 [Scleroderma citrinum Foug A]
MGLGKVVNKSETVVADEQKKKDGATAPATREREEGKSILPFSRVQRIIKVDKVRTTGYRPMWAPLLEKLSNTLVSDLPMVAQDVTVLISLAAEEFIKKLAEASQKVAEREKWSTGQHRDIVRLGSKCRATRRGVSLSRWQVCDNSYRIHAQSPQRSANRKHSGKSSVPEGPTLLDKFMKRTREDESQGDVVTGKSSADIVMDEDGIMYTAQWESDSVDMTVDTSSTIVKMGGKEIAGIDRTVVGKKQNAPENALNLLSAWLLLGLQ